MAKPVLGVAIIILYELSMVTSAVLSHKNGCRRLLAKPTTSVGNDHQISTTAGPGQATTAHFIADPAFQARLLTRWQIFTMLVHMYRVDASNWPRLEQKNCRLYRLLKALYDAEKRGGQYAAQNRELVERYFNETTAKKIIPDTVEISESEKEDKPSSASNPMQNAAYMPPDVFTFMRAYLAWVALSNVYRPVEIGNGAYGALNDLMEARNSTYMALLNYVLNNSAQASDFNCFAQTLPTSPAALEYASAAALTPDSTCSPVRPGTDTAVACEPAATGNEAATGTVAQNGRGTAGASEVTNRRSARTLNAIRHGTPNADRVGASVNGASANSADTGDAAVDGEPVGFAAVGGAAADGPTVGFAAIGGAAADGQPVGFAAVGGAAIGGAATDGPTVGFAAVGGADTGDTAADDQPVGFAAMGGAATDGPTVGFAAIGGADTGDTAADDQPVGFAAMGGAATDGPTVGFAAVGGADTGDTAADDQPVGFAAMGGAATDGPTVGFAAIGGVAADGQPVGFAAVGGATTNGPTVGFAAVGDAAMGGAAADDADRNSGGTSIVRKGSGSELPQVKTGRQRVAKWKWSTWV